MIYAWQQEQYNRLVKAYLSGTLPHALLIHGLAGVGKYDVASQLANTVLCEKAESLPCGSCESCRWFEAGSHPDMFEVRPEEKSKVIKISQIRSLIQRLQKTAQKRYQVVILHPADQLNRAAANALLKTLEEPAGAVLIMLLSDRPSRLPATILSRCQRVSFQVNDSRLAVEWIKDNCPGQDADLLFRQTMGAPLLAPVLMDAGYLELRDTFIQHLVAAALNNQNAVAVVNELLKNDPRLMLRALMTLVADLVKINWGSDSSYVCNIDCMASLQSLSGRLAADRLLGFYKEVLSAYEDVTGGVHVNVPLVFESLMLHWMSMVSR